MQMDLKNLNLSDFIRYILAGFNFIFFVIALPWAYLQPDIIKELLTETSFFTIAVLSVAIGYLLDVLRIYQLTPKFISHRTSFLKSIAEILDVPEEYATNYFSFTIKYWKKHSSYDLERRQAEWILSLETAVIFVISVLIWSAISIVVYLEQGIGQIIIIPICAAIVFLLLTIRLLGIAERTRRKANQDIELILKMNKTKIRAGWKMIGKETL